MLVAHEGFDDFPFSELDAQGYRLLTGGFGSMPRDLVAGRMPNSFAYRHYGTGTDSGNQFIDKWQCLVIPLSASSAELYVSFGCRVNTQPTYNNRGLMQFMEGNTCHCGLMLSTSGQLFFSRGAAAGTILAGPAGNVTQGAWHSVQIYVKVHDTEGAFEVRLNGVTVLSGTNLDTRNGGTGIIDGVGLGEAASVGVGNSVGGFDMRWDDLVVCNTAGAKNNTWIGDVVIETLPPVSDISTQFTRSTGATNFSTVDERVNSATDFNYTQTVGAKDYYGITPLSANPVSIVAVVATAVTFRDDAGQIQSRLLVKSGANESVGPAEYTLLNSARRSTFVCESNPSGANWNKASVNGVNLGIEAA